MPWFVRVLLRLTVFRGRYVLYLLVIVVPIYVFRVFGSNPLGSLLGPDRVSNGAARNDSASTGTASNDIEAELNRRLPEVQYDCRKGDGDWTYVCDRYTTITNGPLIKDIVGIDVRTTGFEVVDFPTDHPVSKRAMRAWEKEQKRFLALVDLNGAREGKLATLPGIDRALARKMVAASQERPFQSVDDLLRVDGMDSRKLQAIRPLVRVGVSGRVRPEEFFARLEQKPVS